MHSNPSTHIFCAAALAAIMMAAPAAAYFNVYGGPTYTSGVGGFKDGYATGVNNAGIAIGAAYKYDASDTDLGERAFRWDATAATELGNLGADIDGIAHSWAIAINDAGTVVGAAERHDGSGEFIGVRAVRWDASGTAATELGNLGTDSDGVTWSGASAINDSGIVVGDSDKYAGSGDWLGNRAVRWNVSGTVATELENLGSDTSGFTSCFANAINDSGTVFGIAQKYDSEGADQGSRAVRWDTLSTVVTELGNLGTDTSGYTFSYVNAINNAGTAVGIAETYDGSGESIGLRAVRWDASGTVATELGNLGTDSSGSTYSHANDINDIGTAVGTAEIYDESSEFFGYRTVRWEASSTVATALGNLGTDPSGITDSDAFAINNAGIAVGYAADYDGSGTLLGERAVYWDLDGTVMDLNTLIDPASGWTLELANAISDTGWIAGSGKFDPDGAGGQEAYTRLFLLQVPALGVLPGDYNQNGVVDAADYVLWRKNLGSGTSLPNDDTPGVGPDDYTRWRTHFGQTAGNGAGSSSNAAVPEPLTWVMLLTGMLSIFFRRRAVVS
jgi:Protein of unknown function (DUF3466)